MTLMNTPQISGQNLILRWNRYDIEGYRSFLRAKALPEKYVSWDRDTDTYTLVTHRRHASRLGLEIDAAQGEMLPVSEFLFDYQQFVVREAIAAERFCGFLDTGLGKTLIELECARQILAMIGGKVLICTMNQIVPQIIEECGRFYPDMPILKLDTRERLIEWLKSDAGGLAITNYQKFIPGVIPECRHLNGLILDEGSILKTAGGTIKWNVVKSAKGIPFKSSWSATPAPNDVAEYASQASFLEKIQGFWDFFKKEGNGKGDWRLKPHAARAFYEFMASFSIFMRKPARFGFADNLSDLPVPVFHDMAIPATDEQHCFAMRVFAEAGSGMFGDESLGVAHRSKLSQAAKGFVYLDCDGKRISRPIASRKPASVSEIVRGHVAKADQVLVWTVFDEEGSIVHLYLKDLPGVALLTGKTPEKERLETIERFRRGEVQVLISKPALLGFGMNFQFCRAMVFSGWDDSYERFYQAVRRAYRYGQRHAVQIYMPTVSELEGPILENLMRKRANFEADAQAQEDAYLQIYRERMAA